MGWFKDFPPPFFNEVYKAIKQIGLKQCSIGFIFKHVISCFHLFFYYYIFKSECELKTGSTV